MNTRFRFGTASDAEKIARLLPAGCYWCILRDCTTDAYLEFPEAYEDYVVAIIEARGWVLVRGYVRRV